jgi:hypothetical protein
MYLFNRSRIARTDKIVEATGWAVEIAATASAVTGVEIGVWSEVLGTDMGRISWTANFETLTAWEALGDQLVADAGYMSAVVTGNDFFTDAVSDGMVELIHGATGTAPKYQYASVVSATATNGNFGAAMAHGVALATAASAAGGLNTVFAADVTGAYAGVKWITGAADIAAMEASRHAINADPSILELLDAGGHLFMDAVTVMYRRIA